MTDTWTFYKGEWHAGNPPLVGPRDHAIWLGSTVFDGGRFFEGVMPDMDLHATRVNRSAASLGLNPTMTADEIVGLTKEGAGKFGADAQLYVRPMYWGTLDGPSSIIPDPNGAAFALCLYVAPMPLAEGGIAVTKAAYRRPTLENAPTDAKAGCLYPNNARCLREARARGFDNCLVLDMLGNVAETATSNIFMVKDGVVMTPVPNNTFLNGITRQRMLKLLKADGLQVAETTLTYQNFAEADEIFTSGNYGKVGSVIRIDERTLQPGPVAKRARSLYWDFAHST